MEHFPFFFFFSDKNTYSYLLLRNNYQEIMKFFYCLFVSFFPMTYDSYSYGKKITYQGIAKHLVFLVSGVSVFGDLLVITFAVGY